VWTALTFPLTTERSKKSPEVSHDRSTPGFSNSGDVRQRADRVRVMLIDAGRQTAAEPTGTQAPRVHVSVVDTNASRRLRCTRFQLVASERLN